MQTIPRSGRHPGTGRVFLLSRTSKDGLGAAYRAGFAWALGAGYDAIVQMDADLSHPPDRVPALLEALRTADVAVGSRYVAGGAVSNWSWSRRLISWAGNVYVRLVLGLPVHDTTAGFKAFRRHALEDIGAVHSASNGYCFQIENTWRAVRLGLSVAEVPITFSDRTIGTSKMSRSIVAEALTRVIVWRWRELWLPTTARKPARASGAVDERNQHGSRDVAAPATSSTSPRSTCCARWLCSAPWTHRWRAHWQLP
jgi:dolichol-phosphate mannosyltransferase